MRPQIHFFKFLLLTFFLSSQAISLERDFNACSSEEYYYCNMHQNSNRISLIKEYLPLIPTYPSAPRCYHVDCSKCHHVKCFEHENYYEEDEDETETHWVCNCGYERGEGQFPRLWRECRNFSIYPGYLSKDNRKYFSFFHDYLQYINLTKSCNCFWPELSEKAATINDRAYNLFQNLFINTELKKINNDLKLQKEFFTEIPKEGFSLHGILINLICHSFFYSDYDWICHDIDLFSTIHFQEDFSAEIRSRLDDIKEQLAILFLDLYTECLNNHPNQFIKEEIFITSSFLNMSGLGYNGKQCDVIENAYTSILYTSSDENFLYHDLDQERTVQEIFQNQNNHQAHKKIYHTSQDFSTKSELLLYKETANNSNSMSDYAVLRSNNWKQAILNLNQGTIYNNLSLYKDAIDALNRAISLDPYNREAYIERALAYFETGQIALAMQDYQAAKKLTTIPSFKISKGMYVPEDKTEFSKGLVLGTTEGAKISTVEFIPSIFSCFRGILNGLWSFACSPTEVSQDVINSTYALGSFLSSHSAEDCLHCVVPELKELSLTWHTLNDYSRGHKIGYIIGKYGIDIFAPIGIVKGMSKVRALKRANTMYTLEACCNPAKKAIILEESIKRASARAALIELTSTGKLFVKSSNVPNHIMQSKHAWDKIIKLSGNVEEDFKKVLFFLENNKIVNQKNLRNTVAHPKDMPVKNIHLLEYRATIDGQEIQIFLEKYLDTGEVFLKNGWVVTR